jgi:hypothetical protein
MYEFFDSNKNDDIPSFLLALSSQFVNRQEVGVKNFLSGKQIQFNASCVDFKKHMRKRNRITKF